MQEGARIHTTAYPGGHHIFKRLHKFPGNFREALVHDGGPPLGACGAQRAWANAHSYTTQT